MIRIEKTLKSLRLAERYIDRLYNEYNRVQCVSATANKYGYGVYVFMCE